MDLKNVVWTAVIAMGLGIASLVAGVLDNSTLALSLGLTAIASATLSARDKR
jgi:hypothetical protein